MRAFNAYFGEPWPSGVCDGGIQVNTPTEEKCSFCHEMIVDGDQGSFVFGLTGAQEPVHRECSLRMVLGGIGHLEDHQRWCKGEHDPDGGRSYRQSALEVWAWVQEHGV